MATRKASGKTLEAFEQSFRTVPPDSGMAFVLVPYLDPDHSASLTDEFLALDRCMTLVSARRIVDLTGKTQLILRTIEMPAPGG
jgi:hypothetical protein